METAQKLAKMAQKWAKKWQKTLKNTQKKAIFLQKNAQKIQKNVKKVHKKQPQKHKNAAANSGKFPSAKIASTRQKSDKWTGAASQKNWRILQMPIDLMRLLYYNRLHTKGKAQKAFGPL